MIGVHSLWLPILLSSVAVFLVSFILHMTGWHHTDFFRMPDEERAREAIRSLGLPAGDYMMPKPATRAEMRSAEFDEKMRQGPIVTMTVMPGGKFSMGSMMAQWFLYLLVVGAVSAYIAGRALGYKAGYLPVFRFTGATAFASYSLALWPLSIWYRRSWLTTVKYTLDGFLFALLTGGFFGWLWPR